MANAPIGGQSGVVTNPNQFPQWGIGQISGTWKTIEAKTSAEKIADMNLGYLDWFTSQAAAQQQISSQTSALNGQIPVVGNWFDTFSWMQAGEVLLGLVLIAVGVARLTHAVPIATKVAKTVGAVAV